MKTESIWQHFSVVLLQNPFFWDQIKTVQDHFDGCSLSNLVCKKVSTGRKKSFLKGIYEKEVGSISNNKIRTSTCVHQDKTLSKACPRKYIHNEQITGTYSHRISSQSGKGPKPLHKRLLKGINSIKPVRRLAQESNCPILGLLVLWLIFSFAIQLDSVELNSWSSLGSSDIIARKHQNVIMLSQTVPHK